MGLGQRLSSPARLSELSHSKSLARRPGSGNENQRFSRAATGSLDSTRASPHRSPMAEVHADQNAALRRCCSAYRRRQNLYAKTQYGLQRVLDVQRLPHNWVRPHWGLGKPTTPAMAIGFYSRPIINLKNPLYERVSVYLLLTDQCRQLLFMSRY